MVATPLLLGLLAIAAATDLRWRTVYNWNTYPGIVAAWGLNAAGSAATRWFDADPGALARWGWVGLDDSFAGFLACGAILLVCFVLLEVGGGDVKLMAMIGAFLGHQRGLEAMLWTFVLGGCVGLIVLVWRIGPVRLAAMVVRQLLWLVRLGRWSPWTPQERAALRPPLFLAPNALAAVMIVEFGVVDLLDSVL
jgi:Flp pilus assembly protein protease CpaA